MKFKKRKTNSKYRSVHKIYPANWMWPDITCYVKRLGSKTEPYYATEEEMLNEKKYTYKSLSISEKKIYNRNKDGRKRKN